MTDEGGDPADTPHRSPARVRDVYDEIASHFAQTRAYPWPEVESFVDEAASGPVGLDLGCANGRHLELLVEPCETIVGLDVSRGLLDEARERLADTAAARVVLLQGDVAAIPIASSVVDTALYVATIHHLPDRETRRRSLRELARVLSADGVALVSAWSTAHDRFRDVSADAADGFDTTIDWTLPGGETIPRFYHIYAQPELEADLEAAGLAIESFVVSSGNCYARIMTA